MTDLKDAIAEIKKVIDDAVASGDLVPRADAEMAVAEAFRRAADVGKVVGDGHYGDEVHAAIHRIAPADALAEVQRLREEREGFAQLATERLGDIANLHALRFEIEAKRDAALAEVQRLREAVKRRDALIDELCTSVDCAAEDIGGQRGALVIIRDLAALASAQGVKHD